MKTGGTKMMTRRKKRTAATVMTAVLLAGSLLSAAAVFGAETYGKGASGNGGFRDIKGSEWYVSFVTELSGSGIISGYTDGTFRPGNTVTCGQFLAMALQTAQRSGAWGDGEDGFRVRDGSTGPHHWARGFYDAALDRDILTAGELSAAALDRPISREWMAVICSRLLPGSSVTSKEYEAALAGIKDLEEMSPHSYEIVTAYVRGLLSGYPDGTFRPEGYLTRAESSAVICHLKTALERSEAGEKETAETPPKATETPKQEDEESPKTVDEKPEDKAVDWEENPSGFPQGTLAFRYALDGASQDDMQHCLKEGLTASAFDEGQVMADQLFQSFQGFKARAEGQQALGKQGLRKEYICGYPVLMEAVSGQICIYIKPKGTETQYWEVTPGSVSEEFF